jgi:hypothetical protein
LLAASATSKKTNNRTMISAKEQTAHTDALRINDTQCSRELLRKTSSTRSSTMFGAQCAKSFVEQTPRISIKGNGYVMRSAGMRG